MTKRIRKRSIGLRLAGLLVLLALAVPSGVRAANETSGGTLLLWMIDDNGEAGTVRDNLPPYGTYYIDEVPYRPSSEYPTAKIDSARIRVVNAQDDGGLPVYLSMQNMGGGTDYGTTLPLAIQPEVGVVQAGPVWTDLGNYGHVGNEFQVELGFYDGDKWVVMATSETADYYDLWHAGYTRFAALDYPDMTPWKPTFAIPEPSSGLLLLISSALLALRRKREEG